MAILALLLIGLPLGLFVLGWWQYSRIEKVDVAAVLSPRAGRAGTNYLIVGTDSREGIAADDPNAGAFLAEDVGGARTDTIMVLHLEGSGAQLLSVPRDLWVTDPATGQKGRINSTFAAGPANLITAVEQLGIPVDHYMEINFVSFAKLVDAVGGITVDFPTRPATRTRASTSTPPGPTTSTGPRRWPTCAVGTTRSWSMVGGGRIPRRTSGGPSGNGSS